MQTGRVCVGRITTRVYKYTHDGCDTHGAVSGRRGRHVTAARHSDASTREDRPLLCASQSRRPRIRVSRLRSLLPPLVAGERVCVRVSMGIILLPILVPPARERASERVVTVTGRSLLQALAPARFSLSAGRCRERLAFLEDDMCGCCMGFPEDGACVWGAKRDGYL